MRRHTNLEDRKIPGSIDEEEKKQKDEVERPKDLPKEEDQVKSKRKEETKEENQEIPRPLNPNAASSSQPPPPPRVDQRTQERQDTRREDEDNMMKEVMTTRYGKVYHLDPTCNYLTAPRTGMVRTSKKCSRCQEKEKKKGKRGDTVRIKSWGAVFHTDFNCPGCIDSTRFTACTLCAT